MMMKYVRVYCCITAVILTSFLTSAQNSCAVASSQCFQTAGEDKDDFCSTFNAIVDCLRDVANNDTLCSAEYKETINNTYKALQSKGCSGFLTSCAVASSKCAQSVGTDRNDPCSTYLAILDCLRDVANNATLCPADYKEALDNQYKDLQSKGCSAFLNSSQGLCVFAVYKCTQPYIAGEGKDAQCRQARSFLDCLTNVVNNPLCSAEETTKNKEELDKANTALQSQGCSGAGTLASSLLLCLGLGGVAYFLTALK